MFGGTVAGAYELLADDAAHRTAHEAEVHDRELARLAVDLGSADYDRVALPGLQLGLCEALGVGAQIEEPERVGRAQVSFLLGERARIGELLDPLACGQREVVAALRADPEVTVELVVAV